MDAYPVVFYPGNFDRWHHGHFDALQKARVLAGPTGRLVVAINSDEFSRAYKREPSQSQEIRASHVRATGLADEVIINPGFEAQLPLMLQYEADILIAGADWASDADAYARQLYIQNLDVLWRCGIVLVFMARTSGISTTQLIEAESD